MSNNNITVNKKKAAKGVTISNLILQWQKEGRFKGNTLDIDKTMFRDPRHAKYLPMQHGFFPRRACLIKGWYVSP